jgi:RNA polymerase sigma-70 factor (ECF subfamily)
MRTDPDVQLMLAFKAGDERAFHDLFEKYKKQVVNYCYRFCGHRAVAEELAQEAFLRIYKAAPRYRPKARFRTWLFKIAANVCLNEIRRPVYRQQLESLDQLPERDSGQAGPDIELANAERRRMVHQAIRDLPDQQRVALLLRVEGEFSYKEIAAQIGRSVNHVKTLIHRGRLALRQKLALYLGE